MTDDELIAQLEIVKDRALGDSFYVQQELAVGVEEGAAYSRDYQHTSDTIDKAIARLREVSTEQHQREQWWRSSLEREQWEAEDNAKRRAALRTGEHAD